MARTTQPDVKESFDTPAVITLGRVLANNNPSFAKSENTVRKDCFKVAFLVGNTSGLTVAQWAQIIYTAHEGVDLVSITEVHKTANAVAPANNTHGINIEKLVSGTAVGSGDLVLAYPFSPSSTAATPITKRGKDFVLTPGADGDAVTVLNPGDSFAIRTNANLDTIVGCQLTLVFRHVGRGDYRVV